MLDPNEVRNPRYAGATIRDLVRALVRPKKPKSATPAKGREETIELPAREVGLQRKRKGC